MDKLSIKKDRITIVTLTYELEVRLTLLQLISIYRNFELEDIESCIIIVNSNPSNNIIIIDYLKREIKPSVGEVFFEKLKFVTNDEV